MDLMRAFTLMLSGVTAAEADADQVNGILVWRDYVHEAVRRSEGLPSSPGRTVFMPSSEKHRGWKMACDAILDDLREQANDADVLYEEKIAEAAEWQREAEAAEGVAANEEMAAANESAAASACMANREWAAAATHSAAAAMHRAAAVAASARAAEARRRAAQARELADKAMAWGVAARDAHTFGTRLVAPVHKRALRVGEALAKAGGIGGVYGHRDANVDDRPRQMVLRGGTR